MKFVDEATLIVQSGDGGNGCLSFRREKHIPRGGPDGGDGGKGGDVVLVVSSAKRTLFHFRYKHRFKAQRGGNGLGANKTGKGGEDCVIEVPAGTVVKDAESGEFIADLTAENDRCIICNGGRGGKGNKHFASSTHRTPRFSQPGEPGSEKIVRLELKLLADVGLVGLPNAGKSSLITALSSARPKIGAYPFTTLSPNLGVVQDPYGEPFVVADIPGLIEGAHEGAGLGIRFLRHIERTRVLIHVIDAADIQEQNPLSGFNAINKELASYDKSLSKKPQIIVLNKVDLTEGEQGARLFETQYEKSEIFKISALTGQGLEPLLDKLRETVRQINN